MSTLAAYLAAPAKDDMEKARAIYRWITQNISYDIKAYFAKQYGDTSAAGVLKSRTSVCEGYATLFEGLSKAAGLQVVKISGWAKGFGYSETGLGSDTNHAWNAVKVGGAWYLIDSTWGAGHIGDNRQFARDYDDYFFLTPPDQFIYSHLPEDSRWQLLTSPVSKAEFVALPQVQSGFFQNGLTLVSHKTGTFRASNDVTVTVGTPSGVLLLAALEQNGLRLDGKWTFTQREGASYHIDVMFPSAGSYKLVIFAKKRSDPGEYAGALVYDVQAAAGSLTLFGFPQTFSDFHEREVHLDSPKQNGLARGTVQIFKLTVANALNVAAIAGQTWTQLTRQANVFQGPVTIGTGPIEVCAQFSVGAQYQCLLRYDTR